MKHFTLKSRRMLDNLLKTEITYRKLSLVLGKSAGSICDEVNKNGGRSKYNPYLAEQRAQKNHLNCKKRSKLEISPGLKEYVIQKLRDDWSPEQISRDLRNQAKGKNILSHETIYQFIYSAEGKYLKLWKHLRHRKRPERVAHGTRKSRISRSQIPDRTPISLRSYGAQKRTEPGHYEVDLMIFPKTKKVLAVFVDRCTRKTWAYFNDNKTASIMADTIRHFVCETGQHNVKSLSFDNGTENFYHHIVRDEFGTFQTFFCDPYCSWQKGTVENTNKLLRQYFPRNINPNNLTHENLQIALHKLNNRPRKCLNFMTPLFCSV